MTEPGAKLEVVSAPRDHAVGRFGDVLLYVWRGETTRQAVQVVRDTGLALERELGRKFAVIGLVEPNTPLPSSDVRQYLSKVMSNDCGPYVRSSALVFEGDGFQASAVRSVAVGLSLLARQPYPHKVFGSPLEAVNFTVQATPPDSALDRAGLIAAIAELRRSRDGK